MIAATPMAQFQDLGKMCFINDNQGSQQRNIRIKLVYGSRCIRRHFQFRTEVALATHFLDSSPLLVKEEPPGNSSQPVHTIMCII